MGDGTSLEDKIARLCTDKYFSLKKTGKPTINEWTVLSGIVLQKNTDNQLILISLCTGTKCLSGNELKGTTYINRGSKLSDSHAEVLARRAGLRYLYHQINLLFNSQESDVFYLENNKIHLKDVSFHFYSSQTPCGDCSIVPIVVKESANDLSPIKKIKYESLDLSRNGVIIDVYRTGAKCLPNEIQDPHEKGVSYHNVGPLRTKPGRGDRTLSLSCSDKIARWMVMGFQGALLSLLIPSIKFSSIVIGGNCPFSQESMERGLFKRFGTNVTIKISQTKVKFEHIKDDVRIRPCPSSIVWCGVPEKDIEISINGLKQGNTKKSTKSNYLQISRKGLFKNFLIVWDKYLNVNNDKVFERHPKKITYYDCKQYSTAYQKIWKEKLNIFSPWPIKPTYLQEILSF